MQRPGARPLKPSCRPTSTLRSAASRPGTRGAAPARPARNLLPERAHVKTLRPVPPFPLLLAGCGGAPPPPAQPKLVRVLKMGSGDPAADPSGRTWRRPRAHRDDPGLSHRRQARRAPGRRGQRGWQGTAGTSRPSRARLQAAQADAQRALAEADLQRYRDPEGKEHQCVGARCPRRPSRRPMPRLRWQGTRRPTRRWSRIAPV